jgi:hypothetical protein
MRQRVATEADGFSLIKELFAVVVCITKSKGFSAHAPRA